MIKIDLITGFLGSGKTTFLRSYARYLIEKGNHICILENDYGAVNVDMMLLGSLEGEACDLEMVAGGCDPDCHRRRFKTKLIAMGMLGYDRVLVEPSGIFDMDEFFDVLCEEPLDQWYEIGNVITVMDAALPEDLSPESDYILASEAANAGIILLSKVQRASPEAITGSIAHLERAMRRARCSRSLDGAVLIKDWAALTRDDYERILSCGYVRQSYEKLPVHEENAYDSLYYFHLHMSGEEFKAQASKLLADPSFGRIFRIKGFLPTEDGHWLEVNVTKKSSTIRPIAAGQEVLLVIGERLAKDRIDAFWNSRTVS